MQYHMGSLRGSLVFVYKPDMIGSDSAMMPNYEGEPFSGDGVHFYGVDGFAVPANFHEFIRRYPVYVRNWTSKKLKKSSLDPDAEDWTQTLLTHLCQLPKGRKLIRNGEEIHIGGYFHQLGFTDVIHAYNPWAHYGASARRFFNFINLCLTNKKSSLSVKYGKDALSHGMFSIDDTSSMTGDADLNGREYLLMNRSSLYRNETEPPPSIDEVFVAQFREYIAQEEPGLQPLIEAVMSQNRIGEMMEVLGIDRNQFIRDRKRLMQLSETFRADRGMLDE